MGQKELRIALVCYGGVSLAVYMHGVTKEIWKLARASRAFHDDDRVSGGSEDVYVRLLTHLRDEAGLSLRVLPDILTGASAGGINAVFLAEAIHSGRSLEPLTELWLDNADIDRLTDKDARPVWRYAKLWAQPLAEYLLRRPGNAVSESVAPETREEVRTKVSRLIRGRWFQPPFSGLGMSRLLHDALQAVAGSQAAPPLLPPGHPIDLFVTATDFGGHLEMLRLNSPPVVMESEHRMPVSFTARVPLEAGKSLADPYELTFAARATSSFPGAFPPLQVDEIDRLASETGDDWHGRDAFLQRVMPVHSDRGTAGAVNLIDGAVLVNAPFAGAIEALRGRPAHREVDRRFVYIDPRPERFGSDNPGAEAAVKGDAGPVGFFSAIFGSLSTIPREQPIRDNLEALEKQSREASRRRDIVSGMRPAVEDAVDKLFGRTLFLNRPTPRRLKNWRNRAQQAAAENAGFAYHPYAQTKFNGILERLASLALSSAPSLAIPDTQPLVASLRGELERRGLTSLGSDSGGANDAAIAFFRAHDLGFRIRRLRLLARRASREWDADPDIDDSATDDARSAIYDILSLYFDREATAHLGDDFAHAAANVMEAPGQVLDLLAERHLLPELDLKAEEMLSAALTQMPENLRRKMLLTYLGFPYYDIATLPLLGADGLTEFDPVKVDRISPEDARSIREGGTAATLRGTEFYNFGAFFSRAYRENDYLWGRLHGAERMVDLVCSTLENPILDSVCSAYKRELFLAILDEERGRLTADPSLIDAIESEIRERLP
ncbi:patatin-like protein [Altererythrobacter sp. MTPC7]|uniref:patatin-like protein n=1 Tax=Altererythrobacter sp. MTPC7 TaxID=3056567 RepID=UPI0036F43D5A